MLLLIGFQLKAQTDSTKQQNKKEIDAHFNWTELDKNTTLNYLHYFGRTALTVGIKIHHNPRNTYYLHPLDNTIRYPQNFKESIGLNLGYKYELLKNNKDVMPYLFFQTQLSNMRLHNIIKMQNRIIASGKYYITQNILGFSLLIKMTKKWCFNQSVGVGLTTITAKHFNPVSEKYLIENYPRRETLVRLGFTYRIN